MHERSSLIGRLAGAALSALAILAVAGIIALDVMFSIAIAPVGSNHPGPIPPLAPDPGVPHGCTEMANGLLVCDRPAGS